MELCFGVVQLCYCSVAELLGAVQLWFCGVVVL